MANEAETGPVDAGAGPEHSPGQVTRPTGEAIERLQARLQEEASEKTKLWWERYMKGALPSEACPWPPSAAR